MLILIFHLQLLQLATFWLKLLEIWNNIVNFAPIITKKEIFS